MRWVELSLGSDRVGSPFPSYISRAYRYLYVYWVEWLQWNSHIARRMDEFIVDFNFMRPGGRARVCVPTVYAIRFTIKRNIYELTRTNFIISILVKDPIHLARFALDSFVCCVCFFLCDNKYRICHNFCCSFDALQRTFISHLHKKCLHGYRKDGDDDTR